MILLLDNYDSFTYNLAQYLEEEGADLEVVRNDKIAVEEVLGLEPEGILLSPGPCVPEKAGISLELIRRVAGEVPIFGVCLGMQAIGQAFGGRDHSTVIHSVDKVSRQMSRDRSFRERVEHARQELCAE